LDLLAPHRRRPNTAKRFASTRILPRHTTTSAHLLAKDATRTADAETSAKRFASCQSEKIATSHRRRRSRIPRSDSPRPESCPSAQQPRRNLLAKDATRTADAEAEYREAIRLDPNYAAALTNIMILLRLNNREDEAIPFIEKWMQLEPDNFDPPLALASVHKKLGHPAESAQFAAQARTLMKPEDWYNLACLESVCGNVDVAIEHLRRAAEDKEFDRAHAKRDPDLEWIRNDPRFKEIVGE
jgi:tetratricopeptide (TPR) repeat protein